MCQHLVVEALGIGLVAVAPGEGVMGEVEAAIHRPMEALERAGDAGDDVVEPTAVVQAAMNGLVMDRVDPHHAHDETDPRQTPTPPPVDRLPEQDECDVQQCALDQHRRGAHRVAVGEADARTPLADLGGYGEHRQRSVVGDGICQFCGHDLQT